MNVMLNAVVLPMMIGTSELLLIGALVLLLFGGKKLPEMMRGLGQGVRSFKDGMKEGSKAAEAKAAETLRDVKASMRINYFDDDSLIDTIED